MNGTRTPHNSGAQLRSDPKTAFIETVVAGVTGMEAAGQRSLINSDTLPVPNESERAVLEAAGVIFGEMVPRDDLFIFVTLPEGWTKATSPGDDSRHTVLLDDKGRTRATMFFKNTSYDRRADITLRRRFSLGMDYAHDDANNAVQYLVKDGPEVILTSDAHPYPPEQKYGEGYNTAKDAALDEVYNWFNEHYPEWQSFTAYWD